MQINPQLFDLFKQYAELDTSLSDGSTYATAINILEPTLESIGFKTQRLEIPETIAGKKHRVHLLARRIVDTTSPTLLIYNHMDVVPAPYKNGFTFRIEDGYVYVRGAADHKGSTIAVLDGLQKLFVKKAKLRFNLIFLLTTDEETSQLPQLEYLAQHLQIDPSNTFCFDPDTFAGGITTSHLGIFQCKVIAHGTSVHSGMSHLGVNAVESLLALWPSLEKIKHKYTSLKSSAISFPKDGTTEEVRSGLNANMISGGIATNVVPDYAELLLDVRLAPELDVETERSWVRKQLENATATSRANIEIVDGEVFEGYACSHPEIDRFESILHRISGESGQYCVMGSTPVASWTKQLGIQHFGLGVGRYDSNMHGVNERCSIADMEVVSSVLQAYLTQEKSMLNSNQH